MLNLIVSAALLGCARVQAAQAQAGSAPCSDSLSATNATAFAIIYGYPLTQYAASLDPIISSIGTNAIFNENTTATATGAPIVRPNVDTLYSKIAVDLSMDNVVLTVPPVPDGRFYVFPFYDLWSNNFANLGSLSNTKPGKYLLRPAADPSSVGFETSNDPNYLGYINFPTVYGLVLPRILLKNNGSDLQAVHQIQAQIGVKAIGANRPRIAPNLTVGLLGDGSIEPLSFQAPDTLNATAVASLLTVVARVAPFNPPLDPSIAPSVTQLLAEAGVSDGQYVPPPGVDFAFANEIVQTRLLAANALVELYNNHWFDFPPQYSGNFHNQWEIRAIISFIGYLQLVQSEALYPNYLTLGQGSHQTLGQGNHGLSLTADESYILKFSSGKPPVNGFWSLTAYNNASYLIPNPLDVYALGDRSNLTYPDGQQVYLTSRNDPFYILIQPGNVPPPANWTNNWLPAPAGGGNFSVNLRFYGPTGPLYSGGSYSYPIVTKQAALT